MEYIIADSATEAVQATNTDQVIEALLSKLQETADILTPGTQIKRTLEGIRRKIDNFTISIFDVQDDFSATTLDQGSWQEQTERTHRLACTYTAIAKIKLESNDIPGAMMAILQAATFHGLSAGFSHHRKTTAIEKARKAGLAKPEIREKIKNKIILLLTEIKPRHGWPGVYSTAEMITPALQQFLEQDLGRLAEDPKDVQSAACIILEKDAHVKNAYIENLNPRLRK